jgi:hypothetical protein
MSGNAIIAWNQAALKAVRRTRLGPMVACTVHIPHTSMGGPRGAQIPSIVASRGPSSTWSASAAACR